MITVFSRTQSASAIFIALMAVLSPQVSAEEAPEILSFSQNGDLVFEDVSGAPDGRYRVEWSSDLADWRQSWSSLDFIPSDGSPTVIKVPMFYRVFRMEGIAAMPAAVADADYLDGGAPDPAKVELGKLLFWDKLLSGNQNISCATCHHALAGTGDGLSLSLGEGAKGTGIVRQTAAIGQPGAVVERVPRNAPHIFNIGAAEFTTMFHDGRVMKDLGHPKGFDTPAGNNLLSGLENTVAAQAMFPVTSSTEMAGQSGENAIADLAAAGDLPGVWTALSDRLRAVPDYVSRFISVFPDVSSGVDITFAHAANAIASYEMVIGRADKSSFDRFLRGESNALSTSAREGMGLFYGKANCASCHSGKFQTDHNFYAIAMPQIGGGKGDGPSGREDFGLGRETGEEADRYKFRTPSLRNVAVTGPWGHAGAFNTLESVVRHHLDPVVSLNAFDTSQVVLPPRPDLDAIDLIVMSDPVLKGNIAAANELPALNLSETEIDALLTFLQALTDPTCLDLRATVPMSLPSGLPVAD